MSNTTHLRPVEEDEGGRSGRSPQRSRPTKGLPTDRMKFEMQLDVLRSFGRLSGPTKRPVDAATVAKSVGVGAATAGLGNRFLQQAGWLRREGRGKYVADESLIEYMRHRGTDAVHERSAVRHLAEPVRSAWFWRTLSPMLSDGPIRKRDALIALSIEAGAAAGHEPQLENLLVWLEFIGLIEIRDDVIAPASSVPRPTGNDDHSESESEDEHPAGEPSKSAAGGSVSEPTTQNEPRRSDFVLTFNVSVQMTVDDLAELSPDQIRALYEAVGQVAAITART